MGVTAIKRVENRSGFTVKVLDKENSGVLGHDVPIGPGADLPVDMWIPWAQSESDFPVHHLEVAFNGTGRFFIWQAKQGDGDFVRFSTDGTWSNPGNLVAGVSEVDGDRTIVILDDRLELVSQPGRHGITAFIRVDNASSQPVKVLDIEAPGAPGSGVTVDPGDSLDIDMWIPWATNEEEFAKHHLEVQIGGTNKWNIWQAARSDGDYVRFSTDGAWHDPGTRVPGEDEVTLDRALVVRDGSFEVVRAVRKLPPPPESGVDVVTLSRPSNSTFTYTGTSFNRDRPARIKTVTNIARDKNDEVKVPLKVSHRDVPGANFGPVDISPTAGVAFGDLAVDGDWTAEASGSNALLRDYVQIEVAWRLDHEAGTDSRVQCVVKDEAADPDSRIQAIGGVRPDGSRWQLDIAAAIARVKAGVRLYVEAPAGKRAYLVLAVSKRGTEYLKTVADGVEPNNLSALPACP